MSWSLQLHNGDLVANGARLGTVRGGSKLVQDLRSALLTPRGFDDNNPSYGSLLDGGVNEAGDEVASIIGSTDWNRVGLLVESEIRRVCGAQQTAQLARAQNDRRTYGESTLDPGELLTSITDIAMFQAQDSLMVRVSLQTGNGTVTQIDVPLSDQPVVTT